MTPRYLARARPEYVFLGVSLEVWVLREDWSNLEGQQSNPSKFFLSLSQGTICDFLASSVTASSPALCEEGMASVMWGPGRLSCSRLVEHCGMCHVSLRAPLQGSPILLLHKNEHLCSGQPHNEAEWVRAGFVGGPSWWSRDMLV